MCDCSDMALTIMPQLLARAVDEGSECYVLQPIYPQSRIEERHGHHHKRYTGQHRTQET
jgi:hypothetical protein